MRLTALTTVLVTSCLIGCATGGTTVPPLASEELAQYLGRMGLDHVAIRSASGRLSPARIVICRQGSAEASAIKPPLPKLPPDGYALAIRGQRIYLVGADDRGVLYATYEFLERLGCRWLAPGFDFYQGRHERVPQRRQAVLFLPDDVVRTPEFEFRKLYVEEGHSHTGENLRQLVAWMPKLRFNILVIPIDYQGQGRVRWDNWREALTPELRRRGLTLEVGGHGYQNFLNARMENGRLFREHPDWFAMDDSGQRTDNPRWVPCSSNPEAVAHLQGNVLAYLKQRPEIDIFDFWPPDGAKWCTCQACAAMGDPSERHARLVSQMASALRHELSDVRLECIAYSSYLEPPASAAIDESVLVDFCPIAQNFETQVYEPGHANNEKYAGALEAWLQCFKGDVSIYSYYRKYAWCSLPNLIPHYMQRDLRWYRDAGARGISSYAEPGDWFTYELNHYVLGHLAWDPDADVDALVDEFCAARYGPEARTAREVFDTLEATVRYGCSIPFTKPKTPAQYEAFCVRIDDCKRKVAAARERQRDTAVGGHLRRLGLMLEFAARDIAIQRHRAAKGPENQWRRLVDALIAFHQAHADDGVFLWHRRLQAERQYRKYGIPRK